MSRPPLSHRLRSGLQRRLGTPFERRVRAPLRRLRNARHDYTPLFATGASGAGTSVLAVTLAQRLACAGLVYECDAQIGARSFLHVPPLASFGSVAEYQRFIAAREEWTVEAGRRDLQRMLRAWATAPGDTVVAKGPDIHMTRAAFLHGCFPDARFVAIVRDPVANIEGLRRKWPLFGRDPLEASIGFYRGVHERFLDAVDAFPERATVIDYADLVARPDVLVRALSAWLGLPADARHVALPDAPNVEGQGIRNVRGSRVEMVQGANRRARARLERREIEQIESALAPLAARLRRATLPLPEAEAEAGPAPGAAGSARESAR